MSITIKRLGGTLGAEIDGVDLSENLDKTKIAHIRQALLDNLVIFFRDQNLTDEDLVRVGKNFGELAPLPPHRQNPGSQPEILVVEKKPSEKLNFGYEWHSDTTHLPIPPLGSILYALKVPQQGGDTMFANQYLAYDALSDGMKRMLADLRIVFTNANTYGKDATRFKTGVAKDMTVAQAPEEKEVLHPIVRTHPETGRKELYLSTTHFSHIEGMTKAESQPLLDQLSKHAVRPDFTCRFKWRPGSIAMWDNRCTMHYAVNDFPEARRIMQRVTLQGDRPF